MNATRGIALALASLLTACGNSQPVDGGGDGGSAEAATILVLSNRPDLISGADALVEVVLPAGIDERRVSMALDGSDITDQFAKRPNGRYVGTVTGLKEGPNVLSARLPGGKRLNVTITNHPIGGPIFSGPQLQPWPCLEGALDAQCSRPVTYRYLYKSTAGGGLQAYDPENPPDNVGTTTTDQGKTVPYIVRVEQGSQNRGQYEIAVLFDPSKDWQPWAPQDSWNGKIVNYGGSGCGTHYGEATVSGELMNEDALSRGFLTWETSLSHNTMNCNLVVQAESLMMAKERIVEAYGPIRYSIGTGGSGGSIKQQQAANAYPGIFDGIIPAQSFTDTWSTGAGEVMDCRYLVDYFASPQEWGAGVLWTPLAQAAVMGHPTVTICQSWINLFAFDWAFNPRLETQAADPVHQIVNTQSCNITAEEAWDEEANPSGVRCALADYMVNVLGRRSEDGYANRPIDNVGVQYGLKTLLDGTITTAQFLDLNARVGSRDVNYNRVAARAVADLPAIATAYRGGLFNQGDHMHLPIIDMRGNDNEEIHHNYHSYEMRARLDRSNGHHDNQVIWTLGLTIAGDPVYIPKALGVMDQWLAAIEADSSDTPYAQKVVNNKPEAAHDLCTDNLGNELPAAACALLNPYYSEPRVIAGEPMSSDIVKCQLKALQMADYAPVEFSEAQWEQMQAIFPEGVCDYSQPDVGRQPTQVWLDYSAGPGGQPLAATPVPAGWASPSLRLR